MTTKDGKTTIFLTEQEDQRIRTTVQQTTQKCSEKAGQAREAREAKAAISQATGASLMADMGGAPDPDSTETKGGGGTLPVLTVGQPYPPCVVSVRELEPMKIGDLRMETHHRGKRLVVKRASPVVALAGRSWTMVQDEKGNEIERLEMCLHKMRFGDEVMELEKEFVIKEPYFTLTDQGEATIRIDHPTDLVLGWGTIAGEVNDGTEDAAQAEKKARTCKDKGNAALKEQDFAEAHTKYSEGLRIARQDNVSKINPDLARDISRNRAHVNLILNQFDQAKEDAKAALTGRDDTRSKDLDTKAYFRAGSAAYNLGNFEEAKALFEEQQKLTPTDKDAAMYLRKIAIRLREQEKGTYDWKNLRVNLSRTRQRVDVANFTSNIKVSESPGRGRGAFAARPIAAGDLVMCEKAFCVVWGHEREALTAMTYDVRDDRIRAVPVGLTKATVQKLLSNPSQTDKAMELFGDYKGDGKNVIMTEDGPVIDTFRVHDITSRNGFGVWDQYGEEGARHASTGLWLQVAALNHSCLPSVTKELIGDIMIIRATRAIPAGEELWISYDESSDYDARKESLMRTWGFECDCALCEAEKADDPAVRKKRRDLVSEADAFVEKEHWAGAKRLVIAKAQRLLRAIDDTYDAKRYKDLPRTGTRRIQEWLAQAKPRR